MKADLPKQAEKLTTVAYTVALALAFVRIEYRPFSYFQL